MVVASWSDQSWKARKASETRTFWKQLCTQLSMDIAQQVSWYQWYMHVWNAAVYSSAVEHPWSCWTQQRSFSFYIDGPNWNLIITASPCQDRMSESFSRCSQNLSAIKASTASTAAICHYLWVPASMIDGLCCPAQIKFDWSDQKTKSSRRTKSHAGQNCLLHKWPTMLKILDYD